MPRSNVNEQVRQSRWHVVTEGYCAWYWANPQIATTEAEWNKAAELSQRYLQYKAYCEEVLPAWTEVRRVSYADNSVESEQVCKCGQHRRIVMLEAPSGDLCF